MKNNDKTREQLLKDLEKSNAKIAELEKSEVGYRKTEEALKKSEEQFRLITENTSDVITLNTLDLKASYTYISPSIKAMSGYEPEDLLGRSAFEFIHPDDKKNLFPLLKKYVNIKIKKLLTGKNFPLNKTIEYRVKDKSGIWHYFQSTGNIMGDQLLFVTRDITERKKAEKALKESEQKLRNIFENSTNLFYSHTPDHILTYLSPQVKDILGYTQEEALIKWTQLASDNPINEIGLKNTVKAIETGKPQPPYELELVKKSEEKVWVEVREAPLVKDGKTVSIVGALTDITERKQAEEELAKHREHLEDLIKERTDEVERSQKSLVLLMEDVNEINQELKDVNTMLDVTNKELEAFSYSVSHDLRAPLTRMDGFSKALIDSYSNKLDDKAVHFLNRIRASSQHMAKLIDDLLSLSRITREKVSRQKIDLSQTAGKIVKELKASEPGRQVNFEIAKGLSANADMKFVVIVLENLLGNAFKFSGKKKNTIIEFGEKIINEDEVFFIKDNGAGFNMKYYDKIFTAFQRLHSDEEFKGTGIGLAIVQRIINKHGGKIWAESEVDKGTTFYFKFE